MATLDKELLLLILQYLGEEKYKETVHRLESESGCYFNMRYFEELVTQGKWDEMEKYLFGFTKIEDNQQSMKIFFEIRKHKYLEALDKRDHAKAVDILRKDLRFYAPFSEGLFKEMALLLTLDDFRENPKLSMYKKDTESERGVLFRDLEKLIKDNPLFRDKLDFPTIKTSRLRTLINHSLNWQHKLCKNPRPKPEFETLFVDHICNQPIAARAASPAISHPNIAAEVLSPHGPAPGATIPAAPGAPVRRRRFASSSAGSAILMGPQTPSGHMENQTADSNNPLKRPRPCETSQEVGNILPVSYSGHNTLSPDDLPKVVATTLPQGSPVTSMEFHPVQQILLLVGTTGGDVFLWDVGARKKISEKCFDVWKLDACSKELQESLNTDKTASVNHVAWSPDGTLFGVAYSKNIVHIYSFCRDNAVISHLEIEAHRGSVNHLAFSYPNEQLYVVTCGDDRLIKVWDAATGATRFTFEGHEAPVFSVCPHQKENIQFVFSAATDGKVRTWLYDELGARGTYDAPGHSLIRMAYSSDGTREGILLAVSTSDNGVKILATDDGFRLLRTAENRSLAFKVPGGGGFGSSSANAGITMADQSTSFSATKKNEVRTLADGKPRTSNFSTEVSTSWKVTEITEPSQCYSLRLPDNVTVKKVSRLIYTNSGSGVLALASNAEHKLWKWQNSDPNLDGKATANAAHPVLWKPKSGIMMINETSDKNPEQAIPCLALSNNDAYLVSASGGEISLFNMASFKCMATCMPPPPAATFLAFHPSENNIIGIGFEDSSIQIYNLRTSEVGAILKGHRNRITGLAFSLALNILVSSGADSQLCVWGMAGWEKRSSTYLKASKGRSMPAVSDTRVQFHQNEIHLLVVNETQIAIYDAQKLDCLKLWFRWEATSPITSGTYSGDSQSIFVSSEDGTVYVFTASNLRLRCRINPTAYLPSDPSSRVYPLVIAAHPSESNQFGVGLSNGHVYAVEPSESEGTWGTSPPGSTDNFKSFA
ncbi:hypothetical protein Bca101_000389 [Brassica carinata]